MTGSQMALPEILSQPAVDLYDLACSHFHQYPCLSEFIEPLLGHRISRTIAVSAQELLQNHFFRWAILGDQVKNLQMENQLSRLRAGLAAGEYSQFCRTVLKDTAELPTENDVVERLYDSMAEVSGILFFIDRFFKIALIPKSASKTAEFRGNRSGRAICAEAKYIRPSDPLMAYVERWWYTLECITGYSEFNLPPASYFEITHARDRNRHLQQADIDKLNPDPRVRYA